MGIAEARCDIPDSGCARSDSVGYSRLEVHGRTCRGQAGANTTEFTYSDYQDWNNPLNKIEAFYAMTERLNGKVVRDLTTIQTEAGQV